MYSTAVRDRGCRSAVSFSASAACLGGFLHSGDPIRSAIILVTEFLFCVRGSMRPSGHKEFPIGSFCRKPLVVAADSAHRRDWFARSLIDGRAASSEQRTALFGSSLACPEILTNAMSAQLGNLP